MNDVEKILNLMFPFLEKLLIEYGEFYPFAAAMKYDGEIDQIDIFDDDDDNPISETVIEDLKQTLTSEKEKYKAYALFYDVHHTVDQTDLIAVKVEHKIEQVAFTFYYTYELVVGKKLDYKDAWKTEKEMEIFKLSSC